MFASVSFAAFMKPASTPSMTAWKKLEGKAERTRSIGMKALSVVTNGSMSRLSHVVSRLEDRGWVERRPHPTDGRLTEAHLTDEGHRTIADAAPAHVESARALVIDRLTPQQVSQLRDICQTIANGLDDNMSDLVSRVVAPGGQPREMPPDR